MKTNKKKKSALEIPGADKEQSTSFEVPVIHDIW